MSGIIVTQKIKEIIYTEREKLKRGAMIFWKYVNNTFSLLDSFLFLANKSIPLLRDAITKKELQI